MVTARKIAAGLVFVAGYVTLDWLSFIHPLAGFNITPWNPTPALAIALLMRGGFRWLPVVYAALLASEWLSRGVAAPWPAMLFVSAALCAGYGTVAYALVSWVRISPALESQRDAVRLVGVISVGALLTGALFIAALSIANIRPLEEPFEALVRFWIGEAVGIVVTLPIVLMLTVPERRAEIAAMLRRGETLVHATIIVIAMMLVISVEARDLVKFFYVLFLPLIVVATRLGLIGSTFAALGLQCAILVEAKLSTYQALTVFEVQALLLALTVTGLFLGVTVDERRRVQEELEQSKVLAAAGRMAASLAHELNQPLAAVASYARASQLLAGTREAEYERLVDTLAKLVAESNRAADVVRRLRDFFTTGDSRLEKIRLAGLIQPVVGRLQAANPGVVIQTRFDPPGQCVLADGTQLEVVVRNLIANAIEACGSSSEPRVDVDTRVEGGLVTVSVKDNGPGVRAQDLRPIFEPFKSTRATGMGMGLAISRAIIESHGGRLWAQAGPAGHFTFTLPAHDKDHD